MSKISEIAKRFKDFQDEYKYKKEALELLATEWSACENELLEAMTEEGVNSIRIDGVGLVSMSVKNHLSVTAANKEQFFKYLKETGNDGILKLDVNPKTLGAFLDSHLIDIIASDSADPVEARNAALEMLKTHGVSYFTKRGVSLRKA